jgi:hypothetical protein
MSLVVLKRKSNIRNSKISSRTGIFSLNNPRRVDSHRNKVQTQTPMKGNVPRGHGSCCGSYPLKIINSQYKNFDPHVREYNSDKSNTGISVKTNSSSISTRNKWLKRGYPHYIVKDTAPLSYELYNRKIRDQASSKNVGLIDNFLDEDIIDVPACCIKIQKNNIVKSLGARDYSEYLKNKFLNKHCLPTPNSLAHKPVPISGNCTSGIDNTTNNGNSEIEKGNCG